MLGRFEDLGDVVVGFQPHAAGAFHIQDRRHASLHSFRAGDTGHQRFARQLQALVQQRPEGGFIAFRFRAMRGRLRLITPRLLRPSCTCSPFSFSHTPRKLRQPSAF